MAYIEWSEELSVGNLSIDFEHKRLVQIINELYDAMKNGEGLKIVGSSLQRLVTYTKTHFKNEEELMNKNNYVLLDDHKKEHQKFVDEIETLLKRYEAGSVAITIELLNYLKNWLVDHIQGSDKKFGETLTAA